MEQLANDWRDLQAFAIETRKVLNIEQFYCFINFVPIGCDYSPFVSVIYLNKENDGHPTFSRERRRCVNSIDVI